MDFRFGWKDFRKFILLSRLIKQKSVLLSINDRLMNVLNISFKLKITFIYVLKPILRLYLGENIEKDEKDKSYL